jgi:hypothetical protein
MTPTEKGRFCAVCDKCVVDFTMHSTNQLFQVLEKNDKVCGRFRPDQLNRDLGPTPIKKAFSFQWALSGFITFFGVSQAFGQNEPSFPLGKIAPIEKPLTSVPEPNQDSLRQEETIKIYGVILDSETREAIPFATVYCKELGIGASTDLDGKYSFLVNRNELTDSLMMHISFFGYHEIDLRIDGENQPQNIFLTSCAECMEEVQVLGGICVEKPTIWQRIGNWFRHVF